MTWAVASAQAPAPSRQRIVFGSDHKYPPYESLDDNGQPVGFNIDLMRAIGEVMGFEVAFELGPWDRIRRKLEVEGTVDVTDMFYSEARAQALDFANPFTMAYYEIFIRDSTPPINSLEETSGKRVIVQKESYAHDYLRTRGLGAQIVTATSEPDALRLLASGEHDCAIVTQIAGRYAIRNNKLSNIVSTGPPVLPRQYSLVVAKGRSELLSQLNQGLAIVKSTGRYGEIYNRWFGQLEPRRMTFWDVAWYAVWVAPPLVLLAAVAFMWTRSLRRQVIEKTRDLSIELKERKRAEGALRQSEELYRTIARNFPNGAVILFDSDLRYMIADGAGLAEAGLSPQMMEGKTIWEVFPKEICDVMEPDYRVALAGETTINEVPYAGKIYFTHTLPVRDEAGKVIAGMVMTQNITRQKQAEEELKENQDRFRQLSEATYEGIFLHEKGRVLDVNRALCLMFGYEETEFIGKSPLDFATPATRERIMAHFRSDSESPVEGECIRKDGSIFSAEIQGKHALYQGRAIRMVAIRDITDRKRAEESLRRYAGRLKTLHEIDRAILEARSSEEIAQVALELMRDMVPCRRASVLLFDFEADSATLLAVVTEGEASVRGGRQLPMKMFRSNEHLLQGKVEKIDDMMNLTDLSPVQKTLLNEGLRSYIKIPLIVKGELIGSFNLGQDAPSAFSEEHVEIAREVADTLAVAIQQAGLYESEQQARRIAEVMREASLAFTQTLDLDMVLETLLIFLNKLVPYDSANVMLRESENRVTVRAVHGYEKWTDADRIRTLSFDARANSTINALLVDRKSLLVPDTREYPGWRSAEGTEHVLCWLGVPLVARGETIGLYSVDKAEPNFFTPEHARLAESLAAQAAVAIQNARLYEQVQRHAETLEERVAERTAELNEHIEEVEHLNLGMGNLLEDLQAVNRHLELMTRRLQDTNEELEAFAYSVSHDLRAPLRAIQGFASALLEDYAGSLDPVGQDYARRVVGAAQRMDGLIQNLLDYSRLSRADLQLKPVNLKSVIQDVLTGLEAEFGRRAAQVSIAGPMPHVMGQYAILVQVISNLLTNAVKFTPSGVPPQVVVRAEEGDGWARLWVEDNGIGISPEHRGRIFRVFERLHGIESYPGTGIGLAIVRRGIERMGGRVGLESSPGSGSRFWIELPRARGRA